MADGRKNNGGHSTKGKAGRKPKADEERLAELISPYIPKAISTVVQIMESGEKDADRLTASKYLIEWLYGKPKQRTDITTNDQSLNAPVTVDQAKSMIKDLDNDV